MLKKEKLVSPVLWTIVCPSTHCCIICFLCSSIYPYPYIDQTLNIYSVTHKRWDFRDDCSEFKLSVFLYSWFPATVNLFLTLPNYSIIRIKIIISDILGVLGRLRSLIFCRWGPPVSVISDLNSNMLKGNVCHHE